MARRPRRKSSHFIGSLRARSSTAWGLHCTPLRAARNTNGASKVTRKWSSPGQALSTVPSGPTASASGVSVAQPRFAAL
eukprot:5522158-Lingulodinium_polyedra.AAC.1